ncbi:MAG: hypothetical protein UT50_C0032G0004 [Candidatus Moranbacteria bacterium GW2011_GWA2_39_41]|nr:MAG: hypothetical protein UT50_C0032G0004 [Candidatus Moranbacteria bacterium GW2011_GWA2_39_41]
MQFKLPKNNDRYQWTLHSIEKMKFYGLSEQKVLGIVKRPKRKEEGIVKNTIAVMQPVSVKMDAKGKTTWKTEIWAMYQTRKARKSKVSSLKSKEDLKMQFFQKLLNPDKIKIISAWRYPGVSPEHNPIPEEILREIAENSME